MLFLSISRNFEKELKLMQMPNCFLLPIGDNHLCL